MEPPRRAPVPPPCTVKTMTPAITEANCAQRNTPDTKEQKACDSAHTRCLEVRVEQISGVGGGGGGDRLSGIVLILKTRTASRGRRVGSASKMFAVRV